MRRLSNPRPREHVSFKAQSPRHTPPKAIFLPPRPSLEWLSMTTSRFLLAFSILLALLCLPGCSTGDGSDIGPNLDAPAQSFLAGSVVDPSGLPMLGALVTIEGAAGPARTRWTGRFVFANAHVVFSTGLLAHAK